MDEKSGLTLTEEHKRICENGVLRITFGPKLDDATEGEICIIKSFIICTPPSILLK
jgi:hypothetical protein